MSNNERIDEMIREEEEKLALFRADARKRGIQSASDELALAIGQFTCY
jgi:hypothetical protein